MTLIEALQNAALYCHPVQYFRVVETHISWVLLTGEFVYKIKKPVAFGFLDYSNLAKRQFYCQEELRLNQRLAPEIYLTVVNITGTIDNPSINGEGDVIEYALQMRQFNDAMQLDKMLQRGELRRGHVEQTALEIAAFHRQAPIASPNARYGDPEMVFNQVRANFHAMAEGSNPPSDRAPWDTLQSWTEQIAHGRRHHFTQRKADGFIRECHGDMHLSNMAWYQARVLIFDCIEFADALRWIDVMSDLAFVVMDLQHRQSHGLANVLLNHYLQNTGDYHGLHVLAYYLAYRAMVRAKVDYIRACQAGLKVGEKNAVLKECRGYMNLARSYTKPRTPRLIIMHGLSGSGKTTLSDQLLYALPLIRIRSDVERKRLRGLAPNSHNNAAVNTGLYSRQFSEKTYRHLRDLAQSVMAAGYHVLVDAAFLKSWQRNLFGALQLECQPIMMHCRGALPELENRVRSRRQLAQDASEADLAVLHHQRQNYKAVGEQENFRVIELDTDEDGSLERALSELMDLGVEPLPSLLRIS